MQWNALEHVLEPYGRGRAAKLLKWVMATKASNLTIKTDARE